ncbi:hypothetical protein [Streptomyces sp. NPDC085932]
MLAAARGLGRAHLHAVEDDDLLVKAEFAGDLAQKLVGRPDDLPLRL